MGVLDQLAGRTLDDHERKQAYERLALGALVVAAIALLAMHFLKKKKPHHHSTGYKPEGMARGPTVRPSTRPAGYRPNMSACGAGWDPAASAEAEALATVGSLQQDGYGGAALQNAIAAAEDGNVSFANTQLANSVRYGGMP
jgi:hypothetical protein